jgi:protein TonB
MTRRRAAWIAAVVAVLLGASYLLTKRRAVEPAVPVAAPVPPSPPTPVPTVEAPAPVVEEAPTDPEPAPTAPLKVTKPEPRSWGSTRAVPARTPPPAPVDTAAAAGDVEEPLPTWIRVGIIAAALIAFFAVSLIATKQV